MSPLLTTRGAGSSTGFGRNNKSDIFELITSITLSTTSSSITFTSLPTAYQHLQVRFITRSNTDGGLDYMYLRFNNNGSDNTYTYKHIVQSSGGTTGASYGGLTQNFGYVSSYLASSYNQANIWSPGLVDINDYRKNKFKIWNGRVGVNDSVHSPPNAYNNWQSVGGGMWANTSAITDITIYCGYGQYISGSKFSLYGIRGA